MKIHPTFHSNLLRPTATDPLPGQHLSPPPPVVINGENEWLVESILDSLMKRRGRGQPKLHYVVQWTGHDNPTTEPAELLENSPDAVAEFHARYPQKPSPPRV